MLTSSSATLLVTHYLQLFYRFYSSYGIRYVYTYYSILTIHLLYYKCKIDTIIILQSIDNHPLSHYTPPPPSILFITYLYDRSVRRNPSLCCRRSVQATRWVYQCREDSTSCRRLKTTRYSREWQTRHALPMWSPWLFELRRIPYMNCVLQPHLHIISDSIFQYHIFWWYRTITKLDLNFLFLLDYVDYFIIPFAL